MSEEKELKDLIIGDTVALFLGRKSRVVVAEIKKIGKTYLHVEYGKKSTRRFKVLDGHEPGTDWVKDRIEVLGDSNIKQINETTRRILGARACSLSREVDWALIEAVEIRRIIEIIVALPKSS